MGAVGIWAWLRSLNYLYTYCQMYALKSIIVQWLKYSLYASWLTHLFPLSYNGLLYLLHLPSNYFNILHKYIFHLHINFVGGPLYCRNHIIHISHCQSTGIYITECSNSFILLMSFMLIPIHLIALGYAYLRFGLPIFIFPLLSMHIYMFQTTHSYLILHRSHCPVSFCVCVNCWCFKDRKK